MIPGLTSWFKHYPEEAGLITGMVIGYGEVEFALLCLLASVLEDDYAATRLLYRLKGESQRIEAADAVIRPAMDKHGLLSKYSVAYGALRRCKGIRNQYAHCHWEDAGVLLFCNPSADLGGHGPNEYLFCQVDLKLLKKQAMLFRNANRCLLFLSNEYSIKVGAQKTKNPWKWPKHFTLPELRA